MTKLLLILVLCVACDRETHERSHVVNSPATGAAKADTPSVAKALTEYGYISFVDSTHFELFDRPKGKRIEFGIPNGGEGSLTMIPMAQEGDWLRIRVFIPQIHLDCPPEPRLDTVVWTRVKNANGKLLVRGFDFEMNCIGG